MERFADDLQGYGLAKGTIRFPIGERLPRPLVKTIVKAKTRGAPEDAPLAPHVVAATTPELPPATLRITIPPRPTRSVQLVGDVVRAAGRGEVPLPLCGDATVMLRPSETAEAAHETRILRVRD
jgi:hypothetical protein